jgi:hypothetical protein
MDMADLLVRKAIADTPTTTALPAVRRPGDFTATEFNDWREAPIAGNLSRCGEERTVVLKGGGNVEPSGEVDTAAAALLLEQLIHPGYDPAQGAEATRRYVRRKANIVVMEHRKREAPERYPWTHIGISERRFYKLLPRFAEKVGGRYQYDHDDVVARMRALLNTTDRGRDIRAQALEVLRSHGFKDDAARKWLQRHQPEEAVDAWPRRRRPDPLNETAAT